MWCGSDLDLISPTNSWSWSIPRIQSSVVESSDKKNEGVPVTCFHKESRALFWYVSWQPSTKRLKKIKFPGENAWSFLSRQIYLIGRQKLHTSYEVRNAGLRLWPQCLSLMPLPDSIRALCLMGSFASALRAQMQMSLGEVTQEAAVNL